MRLAQPIFVVHHPCSTFLSRLFLVYRVLSRSTICSYRRSKHVWTSSNSEFTNEYPSQYRILRNTVKLNSVHRAKVSKSRSVFWQVPPISELDIPKAVNPLRPSQSVPIDSTPVLLLTVAPQFQHRYLNMFCVLAIHINTFQTSGKTVYFVCTTKINRFFRQQLQTQFLFK